MGKKKQIRRLEALCADLNAQLSETNSKLLEVLCKNQRLMEHIIGPTVSAARVERDDDGTKFYDERNQVRMRVGFIG